MIRLTLYTLLICTGTCVIAAPPVPPYRGSQASSLPRDQHFSIETARLAAAEDNSLILVTFFSVMDPASYQLSQQVLWDPQVRRDLGLLHTVELDVDMSFESTRDFEIEQVPTLVLITPELKIIARATGPMDAQAFMRWVADGRRRVADGVWDGLALNKAAESNDDPVAWAIGQLDSRDTATRRRARAELLDQREEAVSPLIQALGDSYLGTRISAYETLSALAEDAPVFEPWLPIADREAQAVAIAQWWAESGELSPSQPSRQLTAAERRTCNDAVESVFVASPVRKTRSMTILVDAGQPALPIVRAAILRAEREGDVDAVLLFEDVRWAILISDDIEADLTVRHDLARGTSEQRQGAADKLGSAGRGALLSLRELINDEDTLVRESAIHALSDVGGSDALAATATMLDARDPNLRMVAAQQLGASGSTDAGQYLASAVDDPDEVVAIAAIAAIEEAGAEKESGALINALKDPRWRVRAAAAEALGKMDISRAAPQLEDCLGDEDTFVVRSALMALRELNAQPSPEKLLALVSRQEAMRPIVIEFLLEQNNAIAVDRILTMYRESSDTIKLDILAAIMSSPSTQRDGEPHWRPLMNEVMGDANAAIRRRGVEVLTGRSYTLAIEYADKALADPDPGVRNAAHLMIVRLVGFHYGLTGNGSQQAGYGVLRSGSKPIPAASTQPSISVSGTGTLNTQTVTIDDVAVGTDQPVVDAPAATEPDNNAPTMNSQKSDTHQRWHDLLIQHVPGKASPAYTFARFVTGDPVADFPEVARLVNEDKLFGSSTGMNRDLVAALLLVHVPIPQGMGLINQIADEPEGYARLLAVSSQADPKIRQLLLDPVRITRILETVSEDHRDAILESVIGGYNSPSLIIGMTQEQGNELVSQLIASPHPLPRATGIFISTLQPGSLPPDIVQPAMTDPNPWIRRAAIQAYLAAETDPAVAEITVGPMIADPSPEVGAAAASGILSLPIRLAAELPPPDAHFIYENSSIRRSWNSSDDSRPPQVINRQPDFLPALKALSLAEDQDETSSDMISLTLAQYGDFSALERRLEKWKAGDRQEVPGVLLVGLLLTKDERYLEPLRQKMSQIDSEYRMRELLTWLRGVRGNEARALRREINLKMREMD